MRLIFLLFVLIVTGCGYLKTRSEIEAQGTDQKKDTQAQKPYQEKAPPAAYRFEEVDEQMRALSGRVDGLDNEVAQMKAAKQSDAANGPKEKQALDQKLMLYEQALNKQEAEIQALNDEVTRLKTPPPLPPAPAVKGKALYDLGEEHFVKKEWKESIVNYQKYRDQNPKGKVFADATYKIGVCFQELGMKDDAKVFLEDVVNKFPGSKEAKKAAFRLKSLK